MKNTSIQPNSTLQAIKVTALSLVAVTAITNTAFAQSNKHIQVIELSAEKFELATRGAETLSHADTKEMLDMLAEDMEAKGYKLTFSKPLPKVVFNPEMALHDEDKPLSRQAQKRIVRRLQQTLANEGFVIDFANQLPRIERLPFDAKCDTAIETDIETDTMNDAAEQALYKEELKPLAQKMLASGNVNQAIQLMQSYEQEAANELAGAGNLNKAEVLNAAETKQMLADITDEMADVGYKITFAKALPKITFNPSQSIYDASKPLTAKLKRQLLDDMQQSLAMDGITVRFSNNPPQIERVPLADADYDAAEVAAERKSLAQAVLASGNVDKAVDILAHYTDAFDDIDSIK